MKILLMILITSFLLTAQTVKRDLSRAETQFVKSGSGKMLNIKVYNKRGEFVFEVKKTLQSKESAPFPVLTGNGGLVLIDVLEDKAAFYNNSGQKINEVRLLGNLPFAYERKVLTDAQDNLVALLISQKEQPNSTVKIFDTNGNLLHRFVVKGTDGSGIKLSPSNNLIAVSTYSWNADSLVQTTGIFDFDGNAILQIPQKFDNGTFSGNGEFFLAYDKHRIFLLDLKNKNLKWKRNFTADELILTAKLNKAGDEIVTVSSTKTELVNGKWINKTAILRKSKLNGADKILTVLNNVDFEKAELLVNKNGIELFLDDKIITVD